MVHVTRLDTAHEIWKSLITIHETKDYQIAITIQRALFRKCASEGDDVIEHLTELKKLWERLNVLEDANFRITDIQFKTIIASSLPPSWDIFTEPYVGRQVSVAEHDPKKLTSSQEFIRILKEEYVKRKERNGSAQQTYYTNTNRNNNNSNNRSRKRGQSKPTGMLCKNCKHDNHTTDNCKWLGQPKCDKCGWFGHTSSDCRRQLKRKSDGGDGGKPKKAKVEETHIAQEQVNATNGEIAVGNEIVFESDDVDMSNYSSQNGTNGSAMILYDWLADSATTSHVSNVRDSFETFTSFIKPVRSVGNAQTCAEGKGTIKVKTQVNRHEYNLTLKDVLYIQTNQQNLLSLGRWDTASGSYHSGQGKLTMNVWNGETVATGTQIVNNLYRLDNFIIQQPAIKSGLTSKVDAGSHTFQTMEPLPTWETWHKCFGHLGMSSIQTLLNKGLVTGLNVDTESPKYDCKACTQAKQHVTPFVKASMEILTKPGELTHTDLWGKYPVQSIHSNQYFHLFLDDSTRRPTLTFLKHKDEAKQAIKDYVAYLKARGMQPNAFRCDQGAEFLNDNLTRWLKEQGIELQITAPYSQSQNGAAEHLNRTLLELARAMIIRADAPLFLWEYALQHATYLRERAPTKALTGKTPYEAWHGRSLICANLEARFTSFYKVKRPRQNCCPGPNSRYLLAMTTDQNQSNITIRTQERCLPRETINSSLIFLTNRGRPNPSMSNFPPLCRVRGSMANYNPHCNREVSVLNQRDNVRSLKSRVMKTRMPESFERKHQLTIVT